MRKPLATPALLPAGAPAPTAMELRSWTAAELIALYRRLPAPAIDEPVGELAATLLDQGSTAGEWLARAVVHHRGRWLAKAFTPLSASTGHGYNLFRGLGGRLQRGVCMRTFLGPSWLDGAPSFHLDYSAFHDGPTGTMRDELRRVEPHVYLGIGRLGFSERQRRHLIPFLLEGPGAPFVPPAQW